MNMTDDQELKNEIAELWDAYRQDGDMVIDAPACKVGMPHVAPYEGVVFPVQMDGVFNMVSIPADKVSRFAAALVALIPESIEMDKLCDAEIALSEAISKAKGE